VKANAKVLQGHAIGEQRDRLSALVECHQHMGTPWNLQTGSLPQADPEFVGILQADNPHRYTAMRRRRHHVGLTTGHSWIAWMSYSSTPQLYMVGMRRGVLDRAVGLMTGGARRTTCTCRRFIAAQGRSR